MNDGLVTQEKEIYFIDVFNYFIENKLKLLLYTLLPLFISLAIFFLVNPIYESNKKTFYLANILVQDRNVGSFISEEFFFNAKILNNSLSKSNLNEKIELNNNFIDSLKIIGGHTELNTLENQIIDSDLSKLVTDLYLKPEEIENVIKNLIAKGNSFKVITFDTNNLRLTESEVRLFFTNLINEINREIEINLDISNINLKEITKLKTNSPLSSIDVNRVNNRLDLINNYINTLKTNFSSFAPKINLDVIQNELASNEDLFNFVLRDNETNKSLIENRLNLDIAAVKKRVSVIQENMDYLNLDRSQSNDTISSTSEPNSSLNADATFIDKIIDLGNKATSKEQRTELIQEITRLQNTKIALERRLDDLNSGTQFEISVDNALSYLVKSLNETSDSLNEYLRTINNVKTSGKPIALLSTSRESSETFLNQLLIPLITILIGSFLISISIITIGFIREKSA
tara:strand:- start:21 stop:1397 length:1377 start_codon:yes stop_codon:yes gene_type:complete